MLRSATSLRWATSLRSLWQEPKEALITVYHWHLRNRAGVYV
ncbi:MAG: hypothetical protein U0745_15205 [Polyangia bacterium]